MKIDIGLLVSGNLGKIAFEYFLKHKQINVQFVLTDKKSEPIQESCRNNKINCFAGNPRKNNDSLKEFLTGKSIHYIFSVNYLFIIGNEILQLPKKHAINIHGSLLPKYRGRTPHVWAIINGEKETGITAHLMEKDCDSGDIIQQLKIPIEEQDTGAKILEKFFDYYPKLLDKIVEDIISGRLTSVKQDNEKATYFGKRTPEDGEINWNWQKERIYNWVRAQSYPYPGAFTWYGKNKLIIDKISFSDVGFSNNDKNGKILKVRGEKPYIKTPNGVIKLEVIRNNKLDFEVGNKLFSKSL